MSANERQIGGDHYREGGEFQHWDLVERFGLGYLEGCATKYISRWRKKGGLQDLEKSEHYLQKLIDLAENNERRNRGYATMQAVMQFCDENGVTNITERSLIAQFCRWESLRQLYELRKDLSQYIEIERNFDYARS